MESKKIKRLMCSVITATLLLCELPGVAPMMESVGVVQEVEAASRKLSSKSVSVMTGEKSKITLKGVSSKKKKSVKWKSNSKNLVVSYSKKDTRSATFYARKAGTYKVTATYGKKTYVAVVKASKKGMNVTSRTLDKGQKYTLKFKGVKGKAKWSSSKKSVVTVKVAKNGKSAVITAKKPGSATITATIGKKKLVCVVKVKGTTAVVTPKPNPTTAPKPTESPKPQPTEAPKPTETPSPTPTEPVKPDEKPTPEPTPVVVKADKITLDKGELDLWAVNQTESIKATVTPENAEDKDVVWESLNTSVVTVDQKGNVTAVANGTTFVKCSLKSNPKVFASCEATVLIYEPPKPATIKATSITVEPKVLNLNTKDYFVGYLEYKIFPENSDETDVVWESDNPEVATVSEDGQVIANGVGTTTIRCYIETNPSLSATCTVNVKGSTEPEVVKVSGITLNPDISLEIKEGSSYTIKATVAPSNATNSSVKWVSSSPDVATVDDSGNVTAIKAGSTMITCTAVDGSGVSASCPVTVKAKSTTTNPSEQDKTDPTYTFKVSTDLKYTKEFEGGDLIDFDITTNAPFEKVSVVSSDNSILQYCGVNVSSGKYNYRFYARKKGSCTISIKIDGVLKKSWVVDVLSDDQNWLAYDSWLSNVIKNINSDGSFEKSDDINKIILVGKYILDNYDYDSSPMSAFHVNGKGNCNASASVLADMATRLGLRADVVNPKALASSAPGHVVARVWYNGKIYHLDAGYEGKAPRGNVQVVSWDANNYEG
ncbi:MAG: Ig domain-containing protein [Blautia faecis]